MRRIKKYQFQKMKCKPDIFFSFAKNIKKFGWKINYEKLINIFYEEFHNGKGIKSPPKRKLDDVLSFLQHFGIVKLKDKEIVVLDKYLINIYSKSIEHALSIQVLLMRIEINNSSFSLSGIFQEILNRIINDGFVKRSFLKEMCLEWLNHKNNIKKYQKESATVFFQTFQLYLHYFNLAIKAPQLAAYFQYENKNQKDKKYKLIKWEEMDPSFWIMIKPNAKSRIFRENVFINYKEVYSLVKENEKNIYEADDYLNLEEEKPTLDNEWKKNREIARNSLPLKCFLNNDHDTFTSNKDGKPYFHYHHIILRSLMKKGRIYENNNLDNKNNIVPLCPNCHEKIHKSVGIEKERDVESIYNYLTEQNLEFIQNKIPSLYNFKKFYGIISEE